MRTIFMAGTLAILLAGGCRQTPDRFPQRIAGGNRLEPPKVYDAQTIFDYMDGAAEIYFTYAFQNLTVVPYQVGPQRVSVEVYDMRTPAEAFGIFSNDWEGQAVDVAQGVSARYLAGTFRGCQGRFFVKIQGEKDTPEVKQFATDLARYLAAKIKAPSEGPGITLMSDLPWGTLKLWQLRYFHRDTNLNNFYYISTENVLALNQDTEGLFAEGAWEKKPVKVLLLQYPTKAQRDQGWEGFCTKVLSDKAAAGPAGERVEEVTPGQFTGLRRLEGPQAQPRLAFCFEAKTAQACQAVLKKMCGVKME
jgi:hypothetical protein